MQEGLVSVIIPVYKTEKYLDRCVKSIVNQTYKNLEIILVDDGSPDRCPQMCNTWANKDGRIRVIHKENGGLSSARNVGIENARGEYICFFDSDDYIDLHTIERAYEQCKKEDADVALFGFFTVNSEKEVTARFVPHPEKTVYCGAEVQRGFLPDLIGENPQRRQQSNLCMSAWTGLFSAELINCVGWRFVSERVIISEDVYSLLVLYQHINKVVILEEAFYYYCENQTSVSRSYRSDRFEKIKHFYLECIKLCNACGYSEEVVRRCAAPFLSFTIAAMKQELAYHRTAMEALNRIRVIINDDVLQSVLKEKEKDKTGTMRKTLFWAMRKKSYRICYLLLAAKNVIG